MYFLGLSVEGGYVLAALYRRGFRSLFLCKTEMFPLGSSWAHILSHLGVHSRKVFLCSPLPVESVFLYTFPVEVASVKVAEEVLPFQLEERLGHSLEGVLASINVPKGRASFPLSILTVQKRVVEEHIAQWRESFLDPDFIVSPIHALGSFLREAFAENAPPLLLHFFSSEVVMILFDGDVLLEVQRLSLKEGEQALQRLLLFFSQKAPGVEATLTGNLVDACTLCPRLKDLVQKYFTLVDLPASYIPYAPYALSMGLASWSAQKESDSGHFRETPSTKMGMRAKKMQVFASVVATVLFVSLVFVGEYVLSTRKAAQENWVMETFPQRPTSLVEAQSILKKKQVVRNADSLWRAFFFPKVGEVLDWLQQKVPDTVFLESFLYQTPEEHGVTFRGGEFIQVDLNIKFSSVQEGEDFCASLSKDPGVVSGSCNFSSSVEDNKLFQVSFFLRNKQFKERGGKSPGKI